MRVGLDIVIVNWNSDKQLRSCLHSVAACEEKHFLVEQVVIIDNASEDHSADGLQCIDLPLKILRNVRNRGFGAAANQGARLGTAKYILFLNPDTIIKSGAISAPLQYIEQCENVGICGIQLMNERSCISRSCCRFPSLSNFIAQILGLTKLPFFLSLNHIMSELDHTETREVDHVIGAFYLIRRSLFDMLGGFDERFFLYLEDLDLSLRAKKAGWKSVYLADAHAFHVGGGTSRQIKATRLFYSLRSRLLYGFKHFNSVRAYVLVLVTLCLEPLTRSVFSLLTSDWKTFLDTHKAYYMLITDFFKNSR